MGKRKILVVDDETRIRDLLALRLSSAGYEVLQARHGEEGVTQAKKHLPDLILMDVMMPRMDGPEAVRVLQEDPATKKIPVIFLTAIITQEEEQYQRSVGLPDAPHYRFIAKPFDPVNLLSAIKEALDHKV